MSGGCTIFLKHHIESFICSFNFQSPRFYLSKAIQQQNQWDSGIGVGSGMDIPFYVIIGFQPIDRLNSKKLHNDSFHRTLVDFVLCNFGTEK